MSTTELFTEAMRRTDAGDHEGFLAMQADDAVWQVPGAQLRGKAELRGWLEPFWQGFTAYRHDLHHVYEVDADTVMAEGTWSSVHDGTLAMPDGTQIPPTGKAVAFRFAIAVRREPGAQVASSVNLYFDQLEFLGQLGLIPEPAGA